MFAELETNLRRERQLDGIANAKAAGVYKGASQPLSAKLSRHSERKGSGRPRSPSGWVSAGRASTAASSEVVSPRMVRLGLADDWRRLDERIEGLSRVRRWRGKIPDVSV